MAKPEDLDLADGGAKGGSKKIIFIVIIALVGLLAVAGTMVGTLWALGMFPGDAQTTGKATEHGEEVVEEVTERQPAVYVEIDPPFVVNFDGQGKARFLQIVMQIMSRDEDALDDAGHHMPAIRHRMLLLFSSQSYDVLSTVEGKELLRQRALTEIQSILQEELNAPVVEDVYFTSLVMQ